MPQTRSLPVEDLVLDRKNFRIPKQRSELATVKALIGINEPAFWSLVESILNDSFLPIENILVWHTDDQFVVKEGNRRIAAVKIILGLISANRVGVPESVRKRIDELSAGQQGALEKIPCAVYPKTEEATVNRIVAQIHGKGQKASRIPWNAVARAREGRDERGVVEPALDLLEKYLKKAPKVTDHQRELWCGTYPLSVLDEALKRLAKRIGFDSPQALANAYPDKMKPAAQRKKLEALVRDVGLELFRYAELRDKETDFVVDREFKVKTEPDGKKKPSTEPDKPTAKPRDRSGDAHPLNDPQSVKAVLRDFTVSGKKREKVAQLRKEAIHLNLRTTPMAFCFVLRSMFEISATVYCREHQIAMTDPNGKEKKLVQVLKDVARHITQNSSQPTKMKQELHGATAILGTPTSLLSVTSMNQLVHNPSFSVAPADLSVLFHQVFPLLREMNA